jgi:hypothetical protein
MYATLLIQSLVKLIIDNVTGEMTGAQCDWSFAGKEESRLRRGCRSGMGLYLTDHLKGVSFINGTALKVFTQEGSIF